VPVVGYQLIAWVLLSVLSVRLYWDTWFCVFSTLCEIRLEPEG
jgi:hypothetical protein